SASRGERPGALLARRTRTMKLCSFDARSKGQPRTLPYREVVRIGEALLDSLLEQPASQVYVPD
ncbi:MAG: hypothetical protein ABI955_01845, partial [Nitrospirota bacterium]